MKSGDWVVSALRALAEQDRERKAPEEVEARLLAAFRQKRARRKTRTAVLATLAIAAGITLFFARPEPKPVVTAPASPQLLVSAPEPAPEPVEVAAPPALKPVRKIQPGPQRPREIVTQFFPLLDAAPPFERGELLRVTVPASTMRRVGLPVNEERMGDRVYADVLVGQEGLARAIRFVSFEQ